jgi:hypothetical protein
VPSKGVKATSTNETNIKYTWRKKTIYSYHHAMSIELPGKKIVEIKVALIDIFGTG